MLPARAKSDMEASRLSISNAGQRPSATSSGARIVPWLIARRCGHAVRVSVGMQNWGAGRGTAFQWLGSRASLRNTNVMGARVYQERLDGRAKELPVRLGGRRGRAPMGERCGSRRADRYPSGRSSVSRALSAPSLVCRVVARRQLVALCTLCLSSRRPARHTTYRPAIRSGVLAVDNSRTTLAQSFSSSVSEPPDLRCASSDACVLLCANET